MTARFETDLVIRKIGTRSWILVEDLVFYSERYHGRFVAPHGFQTDLASIPWWARSLFPLVGDQDKAAVIHDAAYGNSLTSKTGNRIFTTKKVADHLFDEGMRAEHTPALQRWFMYRAVVIGGDPDGHPLAHNNHTNTALRTGVPQVQFGHSTPL